MLEEAAAGTVAMTRMRPDVRLFDSSLTRRRSNQTNQWAVSHFFLQLGGLSLLTRVRLRDITLSQGIYAALRSPLSARLGGARAARHVVDNDKP